MPAQAVARLRLLYDASQRLPVRPVPRGGLRRASPHARYRAFYPEIRLTTTSFATTDSRLSFGHVAEPGTYATTVTRPDLFRHYLEQQIGLLIQNHGVPVTIGLSRHADAGAFRGGQRCRR